MNEIDYTYIATHTKVSAVYIALAVFLSLVFALVYYRKYRKTIDACGMFLLLAYVGVAFSWTVFCRTIKPRQYYGLVPFWSYRAIRQGATALISENLLNVLLLLPTGFLYPLAMGQVSAKKSILFGMACSVLIELLQLILKSGLPEFDDVFHNTIGVALGYGLYRGMRLLVERRKKTKKI